MYGIRRYHLPSIWSEMERLNREMNRLFGSGEELPRSASSVFPPINLYDDGECFLVRAEIPGIDPKSLELHATGDSLTIKGERKAEKGSKSASYHRRERDFGVFNRSIALPEPVDSEKVAATCKLGVLEVRLPRAAEARPRKVAIEA